MPLHRHSVPSSAVPPFFLPFSSSSVSVCWLVLFGPLAFFFLARGPIPPRTQSPRNSPSLGPCLLGGFTICASVFRCNDGNPPTGELVGRNSFDIESRSDPLGIDRAMPGVRSREAARGEWSTSQSAGTPRRAAAFPRARARTHLGAPSHGSVGSVAIASEAGSLHFVGRLASLLSRRATVPSAASCLRSSRRQWGAPGNLSWAAAPLPQAPPVPSPPHGPVARLCSETPGPLRAPRATSHL